MLSLQILLPCHGNVLNSQFKNRKCSWPSYSDSQSRYFGPSSSVRGQSNVTKFLYTALTKVTHSSYMHHSDITDIKININSGGECRRFLAEIHFSSSSVTLSSSSLLSFYFALYREEMGENIFNFLI